MIDAEVVELEDGTFLIELSSRADVIGPLTLAELLAIYDEIKFVKPDRREREYRGL